MLPSLPKKNVDPESVKGVIVKTTDGATWEAQVDSDGKVYLVKELIPPPPAPDPIEAPEEGDSSEPTPSSPEPETEPEEPEESSEKEYDPYDYGEEGYDEKELDPIYHKVEEEGDGEPSFEATITDGLGERRPSGTDGSRVDQPDSVPPMPDFIKRQNNDPVFRAKLSSVMLDNKYDRKLKGRTRGKLDMTRLHKVPTESRAVFTQKQSRKGKQYNVMLVVDESGSMSGTKANTAAEVVVFLAKNFEGININVAIVGFNYFVTVRKEFTAPADYDRVYEAIKSMNFHRGSGDNNDYEALQLGYHMFKDAPAGRNILIMISDGQPAPSYRMKYIDIKGRPFKGPENSLSESERTQASNFHALVNANNDRVISFGVGIQSGGWQVPNHKVIKNVKELKPTIIEMLRKQITRG